jgi:hypothetical protein
VPRWTRPSALPPGERPHTTPGAAGTGLCGGGWAGPLRQTVTTTLRHVTAYRHGGGGLAMARAPAGAGRHGVGDAGASCRDFDNGPAGFHVYFPGGSTGSYCTVKVNQITRNSPGNLAFKNPLRITGL